MIRSRVANSKLDVKPVESEACVQSVYTGRMQTRRERRSLRLSRDVS
jgi:hypothetical protein